MANDKQALCKLCKHVHVKKLRCRVYLGKGKLWGLPADKFCGCNYGMTAAERRRA